MLLPKRIKPKKKSKPKIRSDYFPNITTEGFTAEEYRKVLAAILHMETGELEKCSACMKR